MPMMVALLVVAASPIQAVPPVEDVGAATTSDPVNRAAITSLSDYHARRAEAERARAEYERQMAEHRRLVDAAASERQRYEATRAAADAKLAAWTAEYGPEAMARKARTKPHAIATRVTTPPPSTQKPACHNEVRTGSTIPKRVCSNAPTPLSTGPADALLPRATTVR